MQSHPQQACLRSIQDTRVMLGVSRTTLHLLIKSKKLNAVKIGRRTLISQSEIERFIANLSEQALSRSLELT